MNQSGIGSMIYSIKTTNKSLKGQQPDSSIRTGGAKSKDVDSGIITLQRRLLDSGIKKPSTVAGGVNKRRISVDKKRQEISQYERDFKKMGVNDVLVIDGIRSQKSNQETDGLSTEFAVSNKIGPVRDN